MSLSREFLSHSRGLLLEQRALEDPIPIELRRAISAAYYAAWHAVCESVAGKFHEALRPRINRQPAHTGAYVSATRMLDGAKSWHSGPCSEEMKEFCRMFLVLQRLRVKADYDTEFAPRVVDAINAHNSASRACKFIVEQGRNCQYYDSFVLQCLEVKFRDRSKK